MNAHFTQSYSLEEYKQKLKTILKSYIKKEILSDKSVKETVIEDDYLLKNDIGGYDFFVSLPQFKEKLTLYRNNPANHIFIIKFNSENEIINLELKCLYKLKLFNGEWSIYSAFQKHTHRYRISNFMKIFYPNYSSFKELDINEAEKKYILWLQETGIPVIEKREYRNGRPARITRV